MSAHRPEILAPAGDEECLKAAVGAGADAVYFGLAAGFNARARTTNFALEDLPRTFDYLHERGVKGYVTFNIVVYDSELALAEKCLEGIARAGADAIIVQDLGIARFAHALAPTLPIHASTQMTVSSPQGAAIAKELGIKRIVLPRELSIEEIRRMHEGTDLEIECFVHGALCVSWSGQCLTSEAWGQRSANRGQCAQSCRLPYELVVDGVVKGMGLEKYLLSPKDLGAWDLLPDLVDAGVSCFKIEGRYKGPDYVAAAVEKHRKVLDAYLATRQRITLGKEDVRELHFTYSRGFSAGWMKGDDHQELSHGVHPGHRGVRVGVIEKIDGFSMRVKLDADAPEVKPGDWMVVDQGHPEEDEPRGGVFSVGEIVGGRQDIRFGDPGPDMTQVRPGNAIWKSHDSALKRRLLRYIDADRKVAIDLTVRGGPGRPLEVAAQDVFGRAASVVGEVALEAARGEPLGDDVLREKLGAFGETRYELRHLDVHFDAPSAVRPSELKKIRRRIVEALESQPIPKRTHATVSVDAAVLAGAVTAIEQPGDPKIVALCRTIEQVRAVLDAGADEVCLDFMELVGLGEAVKLCRERGARTIIATMRIQKPGEEPFDKRFENLKPDGILARHLGALHRYRGRSGGFTLHGDFSLNAANVITARTLLGLGLETLTPSYDLNVSQLEDIVRGVPANRLEITVHQHLPLYHTEYCVYAHNLSDGKDWRDCGRPCESHRIELQDVRNVAHPVLVDVGCRNTVFNAKAQSAAPHVKMLLARGVRRFRVELVWESADETRRVFEAYRALVQGRRSATDVAKDVGAIERYGVTSGTFQVLSANS